MGVEEALAFLQKKSTTNGDSVFLHLSQLIRHILETKADDAVDLLETSMLLKQTRLFVEDSGGVNLAARTLDEEKFVQTFLELFNVTSKPPPDLDAGEGAQEEPNDGETNADVADFVSKSTFFETVGVGVGRAESYYIVLALKQLGSKPGISKVRFFGKFFGIHGNYYVFETNKQQENDHTEAEEEIKHTEFGRPVESIPQEKEGANVYAYWVCSRLGEAFSQLPDVTPLQIQTARLLTKFLTGNLNVGEPEDGEEASGNIEKNEEWTMPLPGELGKLETWVHQNPHIKKQGRCSLFVQEPETHNESEEEAEEETPKGDEETEQSPQILSSVENDADMSNGSKPWSIAFSSSIKGLKHQVVCLRSFLWPGAYAVATKDGFSNIYIGWGIKNSPFQPALPPEVQKEYDGELLESLELPPVPEPEAQQEATESEAEHDLEEEEEEE